jgi:hypothetical protein
MRISITSGSTTHHLAGQAGVDERTHSSAGDFIHSATVAAQDRSGVRRAAAGQWDRGNLQTTISFTTSRLFETVAAAELWDLDYDSTFLRSGVVACTAGANTRYLREALVQPPNRRIVGCTVFLSYTITGSSFFSSAS